MHVSTALVETSPGPFLEALLQCFANKPAGSKWLGGEPAGVRERLDALFSPPAAWGPHAVFDTPQKTLPEDALVTVDSGAHRILLSQQIKVRRPLGLMQSAGLCTMGAAVPLAAGAKAAQPGTPTVAVVGDGGLEMGLGELATLRDQNIPITIVVLQDESLALIELKQSQAGLERLGVKLGRSKFEDIAVAFGGKGLRVNSREAFAAALSAALHENTFTVIVCEIQVNDYAEKF